MTVEYGRFLFSEDERQREDNCVFFAAMKYIKDQFDVELTRVDFKRFLRKKKKTREGSGIHLLEIPYILDDILSPYNIGVESILFQETTEKCIRDQLSFKDPIIWIKGRRFLKDNRIIEDCCWEFPFIVLLNRRDEEVDHLEYVGNMNDFQVALDMVGGDKAGMPFAFVLGYKES